MKNNLLKNALNELVQDILPISNTFRTELEYIISKWAKRNFEIYSQEFSIVKEYNEKEYQEHMQKTVFRQLASKIGEDCGITEKYEPEPYDYLKDHDYVDKYRTTMWVLKKKSNT